jgi:phage baseplate assembly protein W
VTALPDIASAHWSVALYRDGVVEGLADIDQSIRIILGTPKGTEVLRPDFGADLLLWLDRPVEVAIPNLVRETFEALRQWEPRVTVRHVTADVTGASATLTVQWELADGLLNTTVFPLR